MCMWDEYDGGVSCSSSRYVKAARKEHLCTECGRVIAIGEAYRYNFGVYEGDAYSVHTCRHCQVAEQWLVRECGGYLFESVWEDIGEHIHEYPLLKRSLGRMDKNRRKKWRLPDGSLMPVPRVPKISVHEYVQ